MKYRPYITGTLHGHPALFALDTGAADFGVLAAFADRFQLKRESARPWVRHQFFGMETGVDELGIGREAAFGPVTLLAPVLSITKQLGGAMDLADASVSGAELGGLVTWWDDEGGRLGFEGPAAVTLTANPATYEMERTNELTQAGRVDDALAAVRELRRVAPRDPEYLKGEISLLTRLNRLEEAEEVLARIPAEDATPLSAFLSGLTALRLKRFDAAVRHLLRAVDRGWPEEDKRLARALAAAQVGAGQLDEGIHTLLALKSALPRLMGREKAKAFWAEVIASPDFKTLRDHPRYQELIQPP